MASNKDNRLGDYDEVKHGALEKDADIYKKRKTLSVKENAKLLSRKDKWYYYKDYFLIPTIIAAVVIVICVILGGDLLSERQDEELLVGYVDCIYDKTDADNILKGFADSQKLTYYNTKFVADSFFTTYADNTWLFDYVDRGIIDILVLDKQMYDAYSQKGNLLDLSNYIDEKEFSDYVAKSKDAKGKEVFNAIKCNSIQIYNVQTYAETDAYLAVLYNSSKIDNAVNYLKYSTTFNAAEYKANESE